MKDKATGFSWNPKSQKIEIIGQRSTMSVNKSDAYRLMMMCMMADPKWDILPANWREFLAPKNESGA